MTKRDALYDKLITLALGFFVINMVIVVIGFVVIMGRLEDLHQLEQQVPPIQWTIPSIEICYANRTPTPARPRLECEMWKGIP